MNKKLKMILPNKRLSEKEESLMKVIWEKERVFTKEIREALPEPKPHINTIATTLKRMVEKGFIKYEDFGTTYRYFAAISKKEYSNLFIKPLLNGLFGNSIKNVVAFFAEEEEISAKELKEIIAMIENQKSK